MNESNVKFGVVIVMTVILVWCIPIVAAENTVNQTNVSELYYITIDPIGNVTHGDVFIIHGTTNVPSTEVLTGSIMPDEYHTSADASSIWPVCLLPNISVISTSSGTNLWSVNATDCWGDLPKYKCAYHEEIAHDECSYLVEIARDEVPVIDSGHVSTLQLLTIHYPPNAAHTSTLATTTPTQTPVQTSIIFSSTPTQTTPVPFELPIAAIALLGVILPMFRKKGD